MLFTEIDIALGSVIVAVVVSEHPLLSKMITVYVCADNPVAVAVASPLLQAYVYAPVPPLPEAVAVPSLSPAQSKFI